MIVSRILHAGYIFESAGVQIAFDPIFETPFSTNCSPFPDATFSPQALERESTSIHTYQAVFLSHFHDDHCSLVSLNALPRAIPIYLYCVHDELFEMIEALGFTVHRLRIDQAVTVGGFAVTPRLALDSDIDAVFEICAEGLAILNVVDAWIDPSVLSLRESWDLVLWPFQTMRELDALMPANLEHVVLGEVRQLPPEWIEQLQQLNPRVVVPSSCQIRFEKWSWLNLAYFPITYREFARAFPQSVRMNPGTVFELTPQEFREVGRLNWMIPVGPQDVDYDYDPSILSADSSPLARTTAEIARHFPALSLLERREVDRFCEGLDVTVFDHEGLASGSGSTEVIAYKLFRALKHGEQITSMYLRIDDIDHDELIAKLSKDPLAFQRAQLERLLNSFLL